MYLSRLEIGNFRGIRSARMNFGETTVVIGENDSGKTTLLDAICYILSPAHEDKGIYFMPHDFYMVMDQQAYRPAGQMRINLTFRERKPDEWSNIRQNDFGLTLSDDTETLQELTLEVRATPTADGGRSQAQWRIVAGKDQTTGFSGDLSILDWLRRLNPVFRIRGGIMNDKEEEQADMGLQKEENGLPMPDDRIGEQIRSAFRNLISGRTPANKSELQAGYIAAMNYLESRSNLFNKDGLPLEEIIYEILGKKEDAAMQDTRRIILRHGSAAEKIGLLLFTSAFLQSGGLMADVSAEPIFIIEDPEAHLHPMTLEAVKLLIDRLNWQKIITTQSGSLLSDFPLEDIRRITRNEGNIREFWARPGSLSREELRRLSYHVRKRLNTATFARVWLLVEGESEMWLMPHLARLCGYDLTMEGIVCVEFAQCGISPLIKAANQLGIDWFLMSDGDSAGKSYIETARHFARELGKIPEEHCLRFTERDIEHHLFFNGYQDIYSEYSGIPLPASQNVQPRRIIGRAIHRNSKPFMAIAVIEAIARPGSPGVPSELRKVVEACVKLAGGGR